MIHCSSDFVVPLSDELRTRQIANPLKRRMETVIIAVLEPQVPWGGTKR